MRRKFKIAFVILLVVTVVWTLAWYQHIIDYKQMRKELDETLQGKYGWPTPFWVYKYGLVVGTSGFIICIAWEFLLVEVYNDWRKGKHAKNEKIGWAAKYLVSLAYPLILILYLIVLFASAIFR